MVRHAEAKSVGVLFESDEPVPSKLGTVFWLLEKPRGGRLAVAGYSDHKEDVQSACGASRDRFKDCSGWSARTPTAPMCSRRSQPPPKL